MTGLYLLVLAAVAWRVRWSAQAILAAGILGVGMLLGEGKWAFGLSMLACYLVMWNRSTIAGWRESFGEWWRRIRRTLRGELDIDWTGFAFTRGGFTGWFYEPAEYVPWPDGRPPAPDPNELVASGGLIASPFDDERWSQWMRWYPIRRDRLADHLPILSADRGAIAFYQPPSRPVGWWHRDGWFRPSGRLPHEIVADTAKDQWDY